MKKPSYALKKIDFRAMQDTEAVLSGLHLHTVCHQARCPNMSECYGRGTATFLILGDVCTRSCGFCNVKKGTPSAVDLSEPVRVAEAVSRLKLRYAVITSVTRDDLEDGGAALFVGTILQIRQKNPGIKVEVLVPDFKADKTAIAAVIGASPHVFAHNVETVPSLYGVRKGAVYERSLAVLRLAKDINPVTKLKSALLLGLGERQDEVLRVFDDLIKTGCDYLSIGQYLQPDNSHQPVAEYVTPEKFDWYGTKAKEAGFGHVESGVWVRSSYRAGEYNNR
jgi:lipoyl synthase